MAEPRWVFHAGWPAGAGREGVRMLLRAAREASWMVMMCGFSWPVWMDVGDRHGVAPRRGAGPSGPVAATKEENTRHGRQRSDRVPHREITVPHTERIGRRGLVHAGSFVTQRSGHTDPMTTSRWAVRSGRGTAARVITGIGVLFALIEVVYILMILFGANQTNSFFHFIKSLAEPLALFFPGLFTLDSYNLSVIVNYGLAAVFWIVVASLIARLVSR
jgi:hypothetical protein